MVKMIQVEKFLGSDLKWLNQITVLVRNDVCHQMWISVLLKLTDYIAVTWTIGHSVIRLPPYHCHLNPIEMRWRVKAHLRRDVVTTNAAEAEAMINVECGQTFVNM